MIWPKYKYYIKRNIKNIALYFASLLEQTVIGDDQFDFKAPFKYLKFHIFFRYFLATIFYGVKVKIPKKTLVTFRSTLKKGQTIVFPTHHFIIESHPVYQLFGKINQPFYLMIAREFFDLVLGLAAFPLKMAGCFSVSRGSKGARQSLDFAKNIISQTNLPLVMFPEGESSLNIRSLLPIKKGAALLIKEALKTKKNIFIQPMTFRIEYNPKITQDLIYIIDELEWYLNIKNTPANYKKRILHILDHVITKDLNSLGSNPQESLLSKTNIYYNQVKLYLNKKYEIDFAEERAYEVHIKKIKKISNKEEDLNLIYRWIEIKALMKYLPDPEEEENLAVWAGLTGKLLRIIYNDYGYESTNRIMRNVSIEPILDEPIPVSNFQNKTIDEITEALQEILEELNESANK